MTKEYKDFSKKELWQEIMALINATHFIDPDKESFIKLVEEYSNRT